MNKIEIDKDWLYQKYIEEGLTQKQIGVLLGVSATTINRRLKQFNISAHDGKTWKINKPFILTEYQEEIINGALLGDGCLVIDKKGINPYFGYLSKSREHVIYVCDSLKEYGRKGDYFTTKEYVRKDTGKSYTQTVFRTQANPTFLPIYNKWYKDKIKHIPDDLVLTSTICLIWYLGDGSLTNNGEIQLCTDCFAKEEQEQILLPQLKQFEAYIKCTGRKKSHIYYRIVIPYRQVINFLSYIGDCPVEDYRHKWNYKIPKYTQLNKQPELEQQIILLYKNGTNINQIAKMFNKSFHTIKNCLEKYGIIRNEEL